MTVSLQIFADADDDPKSDDCDVQIEQQILSNFGKKITKKTIFGHL